MKPKKSQPGGDGTAAPIGQGQRDAWEIVLLTQRNRIDQMDLALQFHSFPGKSADEFGEVTLLFLQRCFNEEETRLIQFQCGSSPPPPTFVSAPISVECIK